jgi:Rrf2 family protein
MEGPSGVASTRAIAERFDIPGELLAKVLQRLARHGLVAAHKGVHGGYRLPRSSSEICIADVVRAIDGPLTFTACSPTDARCDQFETCTVRDPLWRVRDRIVSVLQMLSLPDLGTDRDTERIRISLGGHGKKPVAGIEARPVGV